jgi:hypothetical protein
MSLPGPGEGGPGPGHLPTWPTCILPGHLARARCSRTLSPGHGPQRPKIAPAMAGKGAPGMFALPPGNQALQGQFGAFDGHLGEGHHPGLGQPSTGQRMDDPLLGPATCRLDRQTWPYSRPCAGFCAG